MIAKIISPNVAILPKSVTILSVREELRKYWRRLTILKVKNPGWNMTAITVLGGLALMGLCVVLEQVGIGTANPTVMEIGKAAFYIGAGRSSMPHGDNIEGTS